MIPRLLYSSLSKENNTLDKKQIHYLKNVLRIKSGDNLILFDGNGKEAEAIIRIKKNSSAILLINDWHEINRETSVKITIAQALCLSNKMDWVVQKSTELGASSIQPIITTRCQKKLKISRQKEKVERWQRIANAASAQCGRNIFPKVSLPLEWEYFIESINHNKSNACKWLLDPFSKESISNASLFKNKELVIAIGPEAGFSDEEERRAISNKFKLVRCGGRILRTETASIVALSVINDRLGEL